MSSSITAPLIQHTIQAGINYSVDRTTEKLQQKFDDMQKDFSKMDYQAGCVGKVVSVVKWSLFVIGGGGFVGAGVEFFFKAPITLDPMTILIGTTVVGTVSCVAACCLRKKASFEQKEGEKYFTKLRGIYLNAIADASEESAQKTRDSISALGNKLEDVQKYKNQLDGSIENAEKSVTQIQTTASNIRGASQQVSDTIIQINQTMPQIKQQVQNRTDLLQQADNLLGNRVKKQ